MTFESTLQSFLPKKKKQTGKISYPSGIRVATTGPNGRERENIRPWCHWMAYGGEFCCLNSKTYIYIGVVMSVRMAMGP